VPSESLSPADAAKLNEILARHECGLGRLMPVLHEISESYGYLPRLVLEHLAARWGLRVAEVLRVASFYDRFNLKPVGRHVVEVCAGTSCHSRRSKFLLNRLEEEIGVAAGETDRLGRFTLRTVRCLGLCALSPAMKIDGRSFGRVNVDRMAEILEQFP
jgi:NADH:ubiquinone oxidoreductase subunit E